MSLTTKKNLSSILLVWELNSYFVKYIDEALTKTSARKVIALPETSLIRLSPHIYLYISDICMEYVTGNKSVNF